MVYDLCTTTMIRYPLITDEDRLFSDKWLPHRYVKKLFIVQKSQFTHSFCEGTKKVFA